MDGDIFGAVTRLGRDAAAVLVAALHGGPWDPFVPKRCLEVVIKEAGGIPSLPGILRELDALEAAPLLAPVLSEAAIDRITVKVADAAAAAELLSALSRANIPLSDFSLGTPSLDDMFFTLTGRPPKNEPAPGAVEAVDAVEAAS